jgi:hypothetical protein
MDWTVDDLRSYQDVMLTNESGSQIIFYGEAGSWVVKHWSKSRNEIKKSKPIFQCRDGSYLIWWLTRMGYEYR